MARGSVPCLVGGGGVQPRAQAAAEYEAAAVRSGEALLAGTFAAVQALDRETEALAGLQLGPGRPSQLYNCMYPETLWVVGGRPGWGWGVRPWKL